MVIVIIPDGKMEVSMITGRMIPAVGEINREGAYRTDRSAGRESAKKIDLGSNKRKKTRTQKDEKIT